MEFQYPEHNNEDFENFEPDWFNPKPQAKARGPLDNPNDPFLAENVPFFNNPPHPHQNLNLPLNPDSLNLHPTPPKAPEPTPEDDPNSTPFKVPLDRLAKHVGSAHDVEEAQADTPLEKSTPTKDNPASGTPHTQADLPGLPTSGGSAIPQNIKDKHTPHLKGQNLDDVQMIHAPEHVQYIGSKAFTVNNKIYYDQVDPTVTQHEVKHVVDRKMGRDRSPEKIRRWAKTDNWLAEQAARDAERRRRDAEAEAERKRKIAAEEAERKRLAERAALEKKRRDALAAAQKKRKDALIAENLTKDPTAQNKSVKKEPPKRADFTELKKKWRRESEQRKRDKLEKAIALHPGIKAIVHSPGLAIGATALLGLGNPMLGASLWKGAQSLAKPESKPKQDEKAKANEPSGFLGGALKLGQNLMSGGMSFGKNLFNPSASAAPVNTEVAPKPEAPAETKQEDGGLFGGLKSFGKGLVDGGKNLVGGAVDAGKNLADGAKQVGQGALSFAGDAWNGASNWMSKHKAEIAIGVGVVALAGATILTGGAALAVAGAVAGGAAVSAGTVATVVAGGVVAGAGLNLAQQGAHIKDGVIDPTTGQKKTDINFAEVATTGAIGGVMAPVGAAAFGLAPVVVGGLGLVGVGQGVKSGVENVQQGNNWSAAFDFGTAALAAAPFATKGGRGAMFGEQARARTAQTAGQVWNGARNLPNRALNAADEVGYGAKVLASELSPNVVTPEGLIGRPPMPEAPTPRPLRMQGNTPEGLQEPNNVQGNNGTTLKLKLKPGSPEHKGNRWQIYQESNKDNPKALSYEAWSNKYDNNPNMGKPKTTSEDSNRPSWRQSEQDVAGNENQQYSFKDGEEVKYGTKGSVRPESYEPGQSIEAKNYDVQTPAGRSNVARNVSGQVIKRIENLPSGTKQKVIIDIRGQNVSNAELKALKSSILEKTGIDDPNILDIVFKTK